MSLMVRHNVCYNLRYRWKKEVAHLPDWKLYEIYQDFYMSEYAGNNDEKFLQYLKDIGEN